MKAFCRVSCFLSLFEWKIEVLMFTIFFEDSILCVAIHETCRFESIYLYKRLPYREKSWKTSTFACNILSIINLKIQKMCSKFVHENMCISTTPTTPPVVIYTFNSVSFFLHLLFIALYSCCGKIIINTKRNIPLVGSLARICNSSMYVAMRFIFQFPSRYLSMYRS